MISLLITEWSKILVPDEKWFTLEKLDSKPLDPKASEIFEILLNTIIHNTTTEQQKELLDTWISLTEWYLYQTNENSNDRKLKKQANLNWNNARRVRKQFKVLQKISTTRIKEEI